VGRWIGELKECIDVKDGVCDLAFGHKASLVGMDEGVYLIEVL